MTRKVSDLNFIRSEELVEINPEDATVLVIADGELIDVTSRLGKVKTKAKTTEKSPAGVVFMTSILPRRPPTSSPIRHLTPLPRSQS